MEQLLNKDNAITIESIKALESIGFRRWTKGNIDRLYINASQLGLVCTYYNTGNISTAHFNGEKISNSEGYRMKNAKTYVDVSTGIVYSNNNTLKESAKKLVFNVRGF